MYFALRSLERFLAKCSDRTIERLATAMAWCAYQLLGKRRRLMLANIQQAFPQLSESEAQSIAKASLKNFALTNLEFFRSRAHNISADVKIVGAEHLQSALSKGKGAYIICAHMGNWEAMGSALNRQISPIYTVVKKVGTPPVDRFVNELRSHNHFRVIERRQKGDGARQIFATLQRGEAVGFVMDQARPGEPRLPFFGAPAKTNTSFAALHLRQPSPIIPGYITRSGVGKHTVVLWPELELPPTPPGGNEILERSAYFNTVVENIVRQAPEQYFWLHRRWK